MRWGHQRAGLLTTKVMYVCVGGPQDYPDSRICQKGSQSQRTHGNDFLQQKDTEISQQGENAHGVKSRGDHTQTSRDPVPVELHRTDLISPVLGCDNTWETANQGSSVRDSAYRVSVGGQSPRQPLPDTYTTSRLPKGKQEFSINHSACMNNSERMARTLLKSKFPDAS